MRRGEIHFTSGCVPEAGTRGIAGCCLLCGGEWYDENCCGEYSECFCEAKAQTFRDINYKNVILFLLQFLCRPYAFFWERWYS